MEKWDIITRSDKYKALPPEAQVEAKQRFFQRTVVPLLEENPLLNNDTAKNAAFAKFMQSPDDTGEGIVRSTLGSAARGFGEIVPGTLQGVGALTGITPISDLGESARAGLEYVAPVNPIYEQGIPAKVANVAGNVASIIGTSGVGGLAGKVLGAERAAAAGSAAARQALTNQAIQAGAKSALYGTGFAQGAAAKAEENKRLGITGAEGYLNLLGGGVSELAPEMLPFGTALESAAARRLLGGVDDAAGRVIPGIRMSAAQEAAEGGSTQVLSNLSTQLTAPTGVEAPDLFEGAGEAAIWEGVGGAMFGAINKLGRTPPEKQTDEQKAYAAELGAVPVDSTPPITPEESLENFNQGGIPVVSPDGVVTTLPFNREDIRATDLPFNREDIRASELPFTREDIRPTQLPFNREDIRSTELPFSRQNIRGLSQLGQPAISPGLTAAVNTADSIVTTAENTSSDVSQATTAARNIIQGVVDTPQPQVAPTELPAVTPSPAMEQPENLSQTITDSNGEIAPEMSVLPPTVQAGAGVGEAIQPQPIETAPDAIQEQITDEGLLRQERPEMELQGLGEGNAQPQEVAAEGQIQEEVAPPITPQGTPTPATEGKVMPGGSAIERDVTKPEQMTPEELASFQKSESIRVAQVALDRAKSGQDAPNVFTNGFKSKAAMVRAKEADLEVARASNVKPDVWQVTIDAANDKRPVYAGLVESLSDVDQVFDTGPAGEPSAVAPSPRKQLIENLTSKGYTRQGDLYVFSPQTTTVAAPTETAAPSAKEAAVASVVQQPVEGSIPTVEQESATTAIESTEKTDVAKEAMRFLEADLTDTQRAKWTPEMFTAAQAFFDSGGKDFDSLKKAIKFPRVVQQAYLKADKEAAAEQTRREAADAALAREVEKAEKEQAKLEADQKQREELGLKTLNSLIEKTRTNVVQGTVKSSDANQAVAILNKSGAIPNVLFTWIGTSKDFLADPANRVRYPETWKAVSSNPNIEGMSENGQPIVFTDNVGVSDLDRNLAKLQGITPEVAAVRRVILHENIHKGMFFLSLKDKMKLFQFLHRLYSPEELDQLAKSYDEYSDWRINQVSYFSIIEEAMTRDFDSMAEIPRDGIWAEFMQFLRDIWQKITGKTSEPTLKNYKDVFRLIRNSLKNSEKANADRLKNGGKTKYETNDTSVRPYASEGYGSQRMEGVSTGDNSPRAQAIRKAVSESNWNELSPTQRAKALEEFGIQSIQSRYSFDASILPVRVTNERTPKNRPASILSAGPSPAITIQFDTSGLADLLSGDVVTAFANVFDMAQEEVIHAAQHINIYNRWKASKSTDSVGLYELKHYTSMINEVAKIAGDELRSGNPAVANIFTNAWNLYNPNNRAADVNDAIGKIKSAPEAAAFAMELSRMMLQMQRQDFTTETGWMRFVETMKAMLADITNALRTALAMAKNGQVGKRLQDEISEINALINDLESASQPMASKVTYDSPNEEFKIPSASKLSDLSSLPFSYTQSEIVSSILSLGFNPSIRVVNEPTFSRAAVYNGSDGIILNFALLDGKPKYALRAIVHESVHDATHAAIRRPENKEIVDRLNDLMAYAKRKFYSNKSKYGGETSAIFHSFENLDEFLTGAFTEKSFRSLLSKLELSERSKLKPSSEEVSVFRKFMELVMELLNMSGNPSILEEVVKSGEALMMSQTSADFPLSRDNRIENIYQPGLVFRGAKASKVTYESPNEAAFNSGAEVARNSDYDERDKAVRSTIRAAYDLAPKNNGPSVPLDQLFDIAKQSMPDLTEGEFSQILQDLYEDSGALLQAGESPFIVTTPDGQRAGSAIIVSSLPTGAMASAIDPESASTKEFTENIKAINNGTLKAAFDGVQFVNIKPVDHIVKPNKSYEKIAIDYVDGLMGEGQSIEQIATSIMTPMFFDSVGASNDVKARQALTSEVLRRVTDLNGLSNTRLAAKRLEKLEDLLGSFWQGLGTESGGNQGQRAFIIGSPRYSWMFLKNTVKKELKQRRDNILNVQFGKDNATSFTQNSYENADMASTVSADEVAKDTINDTEWDLIKEGEQVFDGARKTIWERVKFLVARIALYARAEATEIKSASKASFTDAQRDELAAILTMPKAEREKAKAKDLAELDSLMAKLLGEESPTDTPTEKKKRNKRKEIIDTVEKRVKAGEPIEPTAEQIASEIEIAENKASQIVYRFEELYRQGFKNPPEGMSKKEQKDSIIRAFRDQVKNPVSFEQFAERLDALKVGEDVAERLFLTASRERADLARVKDFKIAKRKVEIADKQASRLIYSTEERFRQGSKDLETSKSGDSINKAFRDQVATPVSKVDFAARLAKLNVSSDVAERLFKTAEREKTDLEAIAAYNLTQGPKALRRMISEINLMRRGEEIPLRTPIPWRELLSQKAKTVEEYRQRIFDAISANEELKSATPEQKARLADLFTEAWESNRKRILDGMQERLIREKEAKGDLSKKGAEALQEQRMRMVEDINLGIFDNDEIAKIMAEKFGIKSEFTDAEREKIESLIEILQDETLNRVKRNKAAYELLETLSAQTDIPISKLLANFWVSSVLSGMNTVFSIGMSVFSGMGELTTTLYRIFVSAFSNPKQLPSEVAAAFKTLARVLSATPRQANRAWQYLVTGDQAFLDPTMNDALKNMDWDSIGKNTQLAEQMAKSDKTLQKVMGLFMRTVSRLLTALDLFNSGLTKEGSLSLVFRQLNLDPAKIEMLEKKSDLKAYKAQVIRDYFNNVQPKTLNEKALVDSYALAEMMKALDELGNVSENADQMAMQGAMTLDPSGVGGYGYRFVKSMMKSAESGTDKLVERNLRKWDEAQGASDKTEAGVKLALSYIFQFAAYNAANLVGVRFARFAGNKFNQSLSFLPIIGALRLYEAEFDADRIRGKEAFTEMIKRNQLTGVMAAAIGYVVLKAIAEEPDDEKRGAFINGGWSNLTPEKKQQKLASGQKEYTLGFGDTVINYGNWPGSGIIAAIGGLSDLIRFSPEQWSEKTVSNKLMSATASGVFSALEVPALSQFQELFGSSLSSKDPNEQKLTKFARVIGNYAGGFVPRILKDIDYSQDPNLRKYETLWEKIASHIPVYRRYEGKEYYDILGQQIQRNIYPGSREFMVKPTDPAYKVLGALHSRGIWLTPANAEHRMVGKGARRRSLTQEEADNYSLETGKGYKQMLLRYGQRALQMPTERAKAFLLDKADDVRDRALKKVYRGYTPAS